MDKEFLAQIMDEKIYKDYVLSSCVPEILQEKFGFCDLDIFSICYKMPDIFSLKNNDLKANLEELSGFLNLKSNEMRFLILKYPNYLTVKSEIFIHKVKLLSATLGLSAQDVLRLIYQMPPLFDLTKQNVKNQIKLIGKIFQEEEFGIRKLFRREPRLLFLDYDTFEKVSYHISQQLGASQKEITFVFKQNPEAVFDGIDYYDWFVKFALKFFNKQDLKNIVLKCPSFLMMDVETYQTQFNNLCEALELQPKNAINLIRIEPQILFDDIEEKYKLLRNLSLSKDYILNYPKIFSFLEHELIIKFMLTRVLGLNEQFDKVLSINSSLLLSRLSFMQYYKIFEHSNILMPENEFEELYKISSAMLMKEFTPNLEVLSRLIKFYFDTFKDENPENFDLYKLENYLSSFGEYEVAMPSLSRPSRMFPLRQVFYCFGFGERETESVIRRNYSIALLPYKNLIGDFKIFEKYLQDKETVLKLIYEYPSLLSYSPTDLNFMIERNLLKGKFASQSINELI